MRTTIIKSHRKKGPHPLRITTKSYQARIALGKAIRRKRRINRAIVAYDELHRLLARGEITLEEYLIKAEEYHEAYLARYPFMAGTFIPKREDRIIDIP